MGVYENIFLFVFVFKNKISNIDKDSLFKI